MPLVAVTQLIREKCLPFKISTLRSGDYFGEQVKDSQLSKAVLFKLSHVQKEPGILLNCRFGFSTLHFSQGAWMLHYQCKDQQDSGGSSPFGKTARKCVGYMNMPH